MNADAEQPKTSTFKKVYPFIAPFKTKIIFLVVLTALLSVVAMLPPLFTRTIINDVIGNSRKDLLLGIGILMIAVPIVHATISYIQVLGIAYLSQHFVLDVRMSVYKHLLKLHMGFYGKHSTGKLINRIMGDSSTMQQILNVASIQVISDLACSIFAISATLYLNWRLATPIILVVVLFVINYKLSIVKIRSNFRRFKRTSDRLAGGVQNRLSANLTVKTYASEEREGFVFSEQSESTTEHAHDAWLASTNFQYNTQLLQEVGRVSIYFLGCAMILDGTATYGDVTAFTTYAMQILWPAVRFSALAEQLQNVKISAERLFEILDEEPLIKNAENPVKNVPINGNVKFDHVMFEYEPNTPIIKDFSLDVKAGDTIALVGPTGCGKSTILSLLMRLYDTVGGSIKIDDVDIKQLDISYLRSHFGIVLQESLLFTISIADNIKYARPNATMEEVINAAKIAEIHDEIMKLPNKYDSIIGNKDVQLSLGQKQRISIARAVLAQPSILIMDEATSSLDSRSEAAIQRAMEKFLTGRTSFIVAHRLSTIKNATKIVLLDKGFIVECGSHDELMKIENGRYRELYEKHSGKGVIDDENE